MLMKPFSPPRNREMDVPRVRGEDLEVELENDVLTVRGERGHPHARDGERARRIQIGAGEVDGSRELPAASTA